MAYSRKRGYPKRSKTSDYRKGGRYSRSSRRRSGGKKRTYRKKASMSKRRILDITSIKKRDTMLPQTNPTLDPILGGQTLPAILKPGRPIPAGTPAYTYCMPWIPTARYTASGSAPAAQLAKMTSGSPYFVGLSENITISVTGGVPWQWRRICFTYKGPALYQGFTRETPDAIVDYTPELFYRSSFDNDVGEYRPLYDLASYRGTGDDKTTYPEALYLLYSHIFQGKSSQFTTSSTGADWINVMDAKTDNTRVKVCYDKTVTIASGNEDGVQRTYRRYHPMKKTLQYDNLEKGGDYTFSDYSTAGRPGMGDYYVVDLFQPRYGAQGDAGDLIFDPRSTLYWHEK